MWSNWTPAHRWVTLLPTSATLLRELKSTGELDFPALGA